MLFLFFLYFQSIFKKLSARCTSQFVGMLFYNPFLTKGFTYEINHYHPGSQC